MYQYNGRLFLDEVDSKALDLFLEVDGGLLAVLLNERALVELNAARTLREIRAGATEMLDAIRPSGEVCSDDFPPRREACPRCRFRAYCNAQ